jgi:predicted  nucleic acid-binding Zn-ribbon protein
VSDIEHELIATLWDLKVAKDRIDKLTKSNLQLREGCEALKQRIKRLEEAGNELRDCASRIGTVASGEASVIRRTQEAIEEWNNKTK